MIPKYKFKTDDEAIHMYNYSKHGGYDLNKIFDTVDDAKKELEKAIPYFQYRRLQDDVYLIMVFA